MRAIFDVSGHRGARGLFPENTLGGFAGAMALGVTSIELDVATTRDGVVVVTHDSQLNKDIARGPDGAWLTQTGPAITSLTLAELRRYDVGLLRPGSTLAARYPAQVPQDGAAIPTLAELFALTASAKLLLDIEIKTAPDQPDLTLPPQALADAALESAAAAGALDRIALRSFDWRALRHVRVTRPEIPLAVLTGTDSEAAAGLWWGVSDDAARDVVACVVACVDQPRWTPVWAPEHQTLTQQRLAQAHAAGLRVIPWTVNDPADMARLIAWGVDGLCSDRPDLLLEAKARAHAESSR